MRIVLVIIRGAGLGLLIDRIANPMSPCTGIRHPVPPVLGLLLSERPVSQWQLTAWLGCAWAGVQTGLLAAATSACTHLRIAWRT